MTHEDQTPDDAFAVLTTDVKPTLPALFGEFMLLRKEEGNARDLSMLCKLTRTEALGFIGVLVNGVEQMFEIAYNERSSHARHHGHEPDTKAEMWAIILEGMSAHAERIHDNRLVQIALQAQREAQRKENPNDNA